MQLLKQLTSLREKLERSFGPDTASPQFGGSGASAGQCAAVAAILHELLGAEMVSTVVQGESHWFNRLEHDGAVHDIDLTGDQFGLPPVQTGAAGLLYPNARVRTFEDLRTETIERALVLARRADLDKAAAALSSEINKRARSGTPTDL